VPHGLLRKDLVGQMLVAIMRGELPGGSWLVEQDLAERFGVSRTPVREAIGQLSSFGVIRLYPNRGAQVRPFGPNELRDIYLVRQILESEATRLACPRMNQPVLQRVYRQTRAVMDSPEDSPAWARRQMEVDRHLHDLIARSCGSERLHTELDRYWMLIDAVRESLGHRYEARELALREHLKIMDALRRGAPEAAAKAMARHIRQTADAAVDLMFDASRNTAWPDRSRDRVSPT
jgi:DNA-binding GntR family transcriptional regulator